MSRGWKISVVVAALVGIVSTPLIWLLDSPDTGQLVGASVQGATGIAALLWALFQQPTAPVVANTAVVDAAADTGRAEATSGASASTGVKRPHGAGNGEARAERTGDAIAKGRGSSASTGVDYS